MSALSRRASIRGLGLGFLVAIIFALPALAVTPHARAEAAFLRTVDKADTLNVITGDLVHFAGTHVAYACSVDRIVQRGVILGDCGSVAEPMDVFVHVATGRLRVGQRLKILGIVEPPATWTDVSGHTVYYAFIRAVFADPLT